MACEKARGWDIALTVTGFTTLAACAIAASVVRNGRQWTIISAVGTAGAITGILGASLWAARTPDCALRRGTATVRRRVVIRRPATGVVVPTPKTSVFVHRPATGVVVPTPENSDGVRKSVRRRLIYS
jgi:hypothetical protein